MNQQNTNAQTLDIMKAIDGIHGKTWKPETTLALGINADATKVVVMTGDVGGKQEADHLIGIDQKTRQDYGFLAHAETNGVTQKLDHEQRIGALLASTDAGTRQRTAKLVDALRGWGECFFALPTEHEDIQTSVGTPERMEMLSSGQNGEMRNVRFVGKTGAIASRGNRLYVAAVDDKGRITPNTVWTRKQDFASDVGFISRIDQKRKVAIISLKGGKYHFVRLDEMFVGNQDPTLQISTMFRGNGAYIVGLTPKGDTLAEIHRTGNGTKNVHTTPFGNGSNRDALPRVVREAYAAQAAA